MNSSFQANYSYKANIHKEKMIKTRNKSNLLLDKEILNFILPFCDIISILKLMKICKKLNKGEFKKLLKISIDVKISNVFHIYCRKTKKKIFKMDNVLLLRHWEDLIMYKEKYPIFLRIYEVSNNIF